MKEAIAARFDDLIALAQRLKATVEAERPGALLPTFPMMRLGLAVDAMTTALHNHVECCNLPINVPIQPTAAAILSRP